jgi:hypothetical protein
MNMNWSTYRYRAQHGVDPYKPDPTFPVVLLLIRADGHSMVYRHGIDGPLVDPSNQKVYHVMALEGCTYEDESDKEGLMWTKEWRQTNLDLNQRCLETDAMIS